MKMLLDTCTRYDSRGRVGLTKKVAYSQGQSASVIICRSSLLDVDLFHICIHACQSKPPDSQSASLQAVSHKVAWHHLSGIENDRKESATISLLSHNPFSISLPPSVVPFPSRNNLYTSAKKKRELRHRIMSLDYRNGVSILLLIFYLPALATAILLTIRHGVTRSSGWRFMIIFCLARILSACFQLSTIREPNNTSLYVGYSILIGVAVSPLELVALGYVLTAKCNVLCIRFQSLEGPMR